MKKRLLSLFLALAMVLTMVPMKAQAATATGNTAPAGTQEGLYFRYAGWDDTNKVHYEERNHPLETAITLSPNSGSPTYIYYVDANLNEFRLSAEDLTVQNPGVAKIWNEKEWIGAVALHCVGFGTSTISYNGYSITMTGDLPEVGFYTTPTASKSSFLGSGYKVTSQNNQVYFAVSPNYDWKLNSVQLNGDFAAIADVIISNDQTYATITVKKEFVSGDYSLDFVLENSNNQKWNGSRWITLENRFDGLFFRYPNYQNNDHTPVEETDRPAEKKWFTSPNYSSDPFFYVIENGVERRVSPSDLVSSDENVVTVAVNERNSNAAYLEAVGFGTAYITYKGNSSFRVEVEVDVPDVGWYSSSAASKNTYLSSFKVTETDKTFYLVTTNSIKLTKAELDGDFKDIATVAISADQTYATITVTGAPNSDRWYNLRYDCVYRDGRVERDLWANIKLYNGMPSLQYRSGEWHNDSIIENTNWGLDSKMRMVPGGGQHVFFYYVLDGAETRLKASDLTSSDPSVVKVSVSELNGDAVLVETVDFGTATISYTVNGKKCELKVTVGLPDFGFYSQPVADEQYYLESFKVTETDKTYYFVANGTWELTRVTPHQNLAEIATVALAANKKYATITVNDIPNENWGYDVNFDAVDATDNNRTRDGEWCGFRLKNGVPSLMFRHADFDNNGNPVENTSWDLENRWYASPGRTAAMYFYHVDNGVETKVPFSALTVSNNNVIEIAQDSVDGSLTHVRVVGFGTGTIEYTVGGKTYTVTVIVDLPEFGFYTAPVATQGNYISEFNLDATNDTFYFVPINSDWKITSAMLVYNFANGGTVTLAPDGSYAEVKLNGTNKGQQWLDIEYSAVNNANGERRNNWNEGMLVINQLPYLGFCWPDWDAPSGHGPVDSYLSTAPGYATDVWVYLVEGNNETMIDFKDLVSSDTSVIEVVDPGYDNGMVNLKTNGWGNATVSYTANGKTYSFDIVSELQTFGYYIDDVISQANWTREFTVTDTNKTLYFMAQNGYVWDSITPNAALADIATVQVNAAKNIATITFTGIPDEEEMYGFDFIFSNGGNWQGEGNDYIEVKNGTSTQLTRVDVIFELNDGLFMVYDGVNLEQHGSHSRRFVSGTKISDTRWSFSDPAFWDSNRDFEGWIVLTEEEMSDSDGNTWIEWMQIPGTGLMTTAQMMNYTIPQKTTIFMAQWEGNDDDYYTSVWLDLYGGIATFEWDNNTTIDLDNWGNRFRKTPAFVGTTLYSQLGRYIIGNPRHADYTFEGWLMKDDQWNLLSKNLYTTDQILGIDPLADGSYLTIQSTNIIYQVKWKEIPLSAYGFEVEVEDLPVIDATQPVTEVTVGVEEEATTSALSTTANDIVNTVTEELASGSGDINELKEIVTPKVVNSIEKALKDESDLKVVTSVNVETLDEDDLNPKQEADVEAIKEEAKKNNAEIVQVLDLSVSITTIVDGREDATGTISELSEPIVFTVALPEEMKNVPAGYNRTLYVLVIHNNEMKKIPVTVNDDGTISFEASQFSTYALAYEDVKEVAPVVPQNPSKPQGPAQSAGNAPTGDTAPIMMYMVLAMAAMVLMAVAETKRKFVRR